MKKLYLTIVIFCISYSSKSQTRLSTNELDIEGDVLTWYDDIVGKSNTVLQTGGLHHAERKANHSHPYFKVILWVDGSLNYRGQEFNNTPLIYDINKDLLITKNTLNLNFSSEPIELIQNQVSSFNLSGSLFEFYEEEIGNFRKGFFEVLFRGENVEILIKRTKVIETTSTGESFYRVSDKYFIKVGERISSIKKRWQVVRKFPEHKKVIRDFIRKNKIQIIKPNTDPQFVKLMEFCDNLKL